MIFSGRMSWAMGAGEARNGPAIAQSGSVNTNNAHVYDIFSGSPEVQYFVNDRGTPANVAPPAPVEPERSPGDPAVTELVENAYRTHLRRGSEPGGLLNWNAPAQGMHAEGRSAEEISAWLDEQFKASPEAQALERRLRGGAGPRAGQPRRADVDERRAADAR
jgi:hypothetical protein